MSDDDLIRRGDVKACRQSFVSGLGICDILISAVTVADIDAISPVEQPMSAVEYIHISSRMMKEDYRAWDRLMVFEENDDADKAIAWIEEWARKHPEERDKK